MRLSCTSTMVPGKSLTEKARNLSRWGYEGIAVFVDYVDWNQELYQELLSLEECTGAVSYTHLDVYKRQLQGVYQYGCTFLGRRLRRQIML